MSVAMRKFTIGVGEIISRNGHPVGLGLACRPREWKPDEGRVFGVDGVGDAEITPVSRKVAEKITSVATGALVIGVLGAGIGVGISYLSAKAVRGATVGQGAMVGAALGGAMGLLSDFTVRATPSAVTVPYPKVADSKNGVSP